MNKTLFSLILAGSILSSTSHAVPLEQVKPGFAKNVIILIPDGMSTDGVTLTRWVYNNGEPLHLDAIASGLVRTHNSDTIIADSAPAGTAMATGHKTQDKLIGVLPEKATLYGAHKQDEKTPYAPVASVLELAKLQGKSVGIIATSEIMHATPASFTAHVTHRKNYSDITEQQVFQNLDVVFGGGQEFLKAANRDDKQDMFDALKQQGYQIITEKNQLQSVNNHKVWGLFAAKDLAYDIDNQTEPSLAEMTQKAIELLNQNNDGFLLMVEGSKIDWAAHANTTSALISDIKAFDNAVGIALEFAKTNPDTLVLIASDHGNGGLTIGNRATTDIYSTMPLEDFVTTLRMVTMTEESLAKLIQATPEEASALIQQHWQVTPEKCLLDALNATKDVTEIQTILAQELNHLSHLGWTSGGHTGQETVLYVYHDDYANILTGTVQNSDLALYVAKAINGDLQQATKQLFVPSAEVINQGIQYKKDDSDSKNIRFILSKNGNDYVFPQNRNYFEHNGKMTSFNGVVVYNGKDMFIPQEAIDLIK